MNPNPKVLEHVQQLCDVLRTNYQSHAISQHRFYIEQDKNVEFHQKEIDKLSMGEGVYEYSFTLGRKYAKIIMKTPGSSSGSAHAFVDLQTGEIYKAASWSSPAKGIRYNLLDEKSRQEVYQRADWSGGWTYAR